MWMKNQIRGVNMVIFNEPYNEKLVSTQTDINPASRRYKANNIQALRAMYEISKNHGNIDSEDFDPDIRDLLSRDKFAYNKGANTVALAKNLKKLIKVWPAIEKEPRLGAKVAGMLGAFHTAWDEYADAIDVYADNEEYPVYMDVNRYLETLLSKVDENGNINSDIYKTQDEYYSLATDWRAEINVQYQKYLERKKQSDQEGE